MSSVLPIVAIVGRANVGKSSLFNAILDRREAIVAQEAGTTRDSITAKGEYRGQHFWLVDTAGIKEAADDFELTIQDQILQAADSADVIWVVIEANVPITDEDRRVATMALKSRKPVFLVVNKADKAPKAIPEDYQRLGVKPIILTSTTQNSGIDDLLDELVAIIPRKQLHEDSDRIRIALLGRPNVGKSQLFNAMAKKQQAVVSSRAGTTRDVNRAVVRYQARELELMDTAGIRRNGKIEKGVEQFSVVRSLAAIEQADVCLLVMDVNELHSHLDQKIAGMIAEANKGLVLVISKWDSLSEKTAFSRDEMASELRHTYDFVAWAPVIVTSGITGQNAAKIFDLALEIHTERHKQLKTTELNRWLQFITDKHPPAGLKNRQPKLNYMVQEKENPTNFKVYGAHTKLLHWSYKRYMERELREAFGFNGTAIKLWFFEKHTTHKHGTKPDSN